MTLAYPKWKRAEERVVCSRMRGKADFCKPQQWHAVFPSAKLCKFQESRLVNETFASAEAERVCLLLQLHGRLAKGKGMKLFLKLWGKNE